MGTHRPTGSGTDGIAFTLGVVWSGQLPALWELCVLYDVLLPCLAWWELLRVGSVGSVGCEDERKEVYGWGCI